MEYILSGPRGPRHVRQGLACFHISRAGGRSPPETILARTPLLQAPSSPSITVDAPSERITELMLKLATS
eukprot:1815522-Pyramimonas_sp.AAC.1